MTAILAKDAKRAHPDRPETWQPALHRGKKQVAEMRAERRSEQYIANMLFDTCQNVPKCHFQKFLDQLGVKYNRKSW